MKKIIKLTENDLARIVRRVIMEEAEDDSGVVVDVTKIDADDMKCFDSISSEEAKQVGLNHGGKYKVKKKGCQTKTKYTGPKQKYSGRSWPE